MNRNNLFYILILGFFACTSFLYQYMDNDDLLFLISPINTLIEWNINSSATYSLELGYFYESLNINIGKSCSGFNFWMLSFVLCVFLILPLFKTWQKKLMIIFGVLFVNYLTTLFINFSRISIAILMKKSQIDILQGKAAHLAEGSFVYLFSLIAIYFLLNSFLIPNYEKFSKA